jgi:hypothetical protein
MGRIRDIDEAGRHVVRLHGREYDWEDAVGLVPCRAGEAMARRPINPDRFDRYHPLLGHLLAGEVLDDAPPAVPPTLPEAPTPPACVPGICPPTDTGAGPGSPPAVVPEPPSAAMLVLAALPLLLALAAARVGGRPLARLLWVGAYLAAPLLAAVLILATGILCGLECLE